MGKFVKRAELSILGTLGIALISYTHMPTILASLDGTAPEPSSYSASAAASLQPYVEETTSGPTPVTITTTPIATNEALAASSTSQTVSSATSPQTTDANAVIPTDNAARDIDPMP